jgi:hypothetical protein
MTDAGRNPDSRGRQKKAVFRTVLALLVVVFGIYLFFIGRAFINYSGA